MFNSKVYEASLIKIHVFIAFLPKTSAKLAFFVVGRLQTAHLLMRCSDHYLSKNILKNTDIAAVGIGYLSHKP